MTKSMLASLTLLAASLGALSFLGFAQDRPKQENGAGIPDFTLKAWTSQRARKANLFVDRTGRIIRSSAHVDREGIPDWVHALADEKLGKGEDAAYEIEVYPDGSEVYEVYRTIDGRERQLSVRAGDRKLYYLGTMVDAKDLPANAARALSGLKGFQVEKCVLKEGPSFTEYHVRGFRDGVPYRVRLAKDGSMIAAQKRIPAEIEVAMED